MDYCTVDYYTVDYCSADYYSVYYCALDQNTVDYCTVDYCTIDYCSVDSCTVDSCTVDYIRRVLCTPVDPPLRYIIHASLCALHHLGTLSVCLQVQVQVHMGIGGSYRRNSIVGENKLGSMSEILSSIILFRYFHIPRQYRPIVYFTGTR